MSRRKIISKEHKIPVVAAILQSAVSAVLAFTALRDRSINMLHLLFQLAIWSVFTMNCSLWAYTKYRAFVMLASDIPRRRRIIRQMRGEWL